MHVVIIGGSGFLGRNLISYLVSKSKYSITNIDITESAFDKKIEYIQSKVITEAEIEKIFLGIKKKYGNDVSVIHLAGMGDKKKCESYPDQATFSNLVLSKSIIKSCQKMDFKTFIFPSTGLVYKEQPGKGLSEGDDVSGMSVYTNVKLNTENELNNFSQSSNVRCFVMRIANVYGPESGENTFFGTILQQVIKRKEVITVQRSTPRIDLIYIEDVSRCFQYIIDSDLKGKFFLYNVSSGTSISIQKVITILCKEANLNSNIVETYPIEGDYTDMILSNIKIKNDLGWEPLYSIKDGIRDILLKLNNKNL